MKILCLGNEFIKEDSLGKKVAKELADEVNDKSDVDIINIKDSFELVDYLQDKDKDEFVILDVVLGLGEVRLLEIDDLQQDSILSAHDFDAGFFLKLLGSKDIKIIGIPMRGDVGRIKEEVMKKLRI